MLTEGMFRVYDSLNYSVLYTNGNDNHSESPQMALSQNGAKAVLCACQSKEMIEVTKHGIFNLCPNFEFFY